MSPNRPSRLALYEKSSMLHWHPRTCDLPIPQPKTEIVNVPNEVLESMLEADSPAPIRYVSKFYSAMDLLMPFPIFLRTDNSSQKHMFKKTCRLPDRMSVFGHVMALVDANRECGLRDNAIVFRKWLDLDAGFAAFDGLPIPAEARAFIRDGEVERICPYWSEDYIGSWVKARQGPSAHRNGAPIDPGWKKMLKSQNQTVMKDVPVLEEYAGMVAGRISGYWSVDFARGRDGRWYLIDMAAGELSRQA